VSKKCDAEGTLLADNSVENGLQKFARRWRTSVCIIKIDEGLSLPGERDALKPSLFRFMTSAFREVLFFKNSPKLGTIQKAPRGTMGIFGPTIKVANDICNAKLAVKLGK
jgi:hypothetical protein